MMVNPSPGWPMRIDTGWYGRRFVVALRGELDGASAPDCAAVVTDMIGIAIASVEPGDTDPVVVVDLCGLTTVSAAGLHMLREMSTRCVERGLALQVRVPLDGVVRRSAGVGASTGDLAVTTCDGIRTTHS